MNIGTRNLRFKLALTVATTALLLSPIAVQAQSSDLVRAIDLVSERENTRGNGNGGGNGQGNRNVLDVFDTTSTQTDLHVLAPTVIAEWNQFNVPGGATLNVHNNSSADVATLLNRVIGSDVSDISGTINAQDVNFWLINQNGILFGTTANINANSFFASTLDVDNADFFVFHNRDGESGSLNFIDNSSVAGSITSAGSPNFTTNGSLFFASEALDIQGNFNADGRVSFIAATDMDVRFDSYSPVEFTLNKGTEIATQRVGGAVTGKGVDFQFLSASDAVNALLTIDADVTANAARATDNGIRLFAAQSGGKITSVVTNAELLSTGIISSEIDGHLTANADLTGASINLNVDRNIVAQNITARDGNLSLSARNITTGNLRGESISTISTTGATTTGSQLASRNITAVSAAGYNSGFMRTIGGNITVNAENNVGIGGFNSGRTARVTSNTGNITLSGNARSEGSMILSSPQGAIFGDTGGNFRLESGNDLITDDITSRGGDLILRAESDIETGALNAMADINTNSRTGITRVSGVQDAGGSITASSGGSYESGFMRSRGGDIAINAENRATIDGFNSAAHASITSNRENIVLTANGSSADSMLLRTPRGRVIGRTGGNLLLQSGTDLATNGVTAEANLTLSAGTNLQTGDLGAGGNIRTMSTTGSTNTGNQIARDGSIVGTAGTTYTSRFLRASGGNIIVNSSDTASIRGFNTAGRISVEATTGDVLVTDQGIAAGDINLTAHAGSVDARALSTTGNGSDIMLTAANSVHANNLSAGGNISTTSTTGQTQLGTQVAGGTVRAISGTTYISDHISSGGLLEVIAGDNAAIGGIDSGGTSTINSGGAVIISDNIVSAGTTTLTALGGNVNAQSIQTTGDGALIDIMAMNGAVSTGELRTEGDGSNIDVRAHNNATVDGFNSSASTSISSSNGNVVVTADGQSSGSLDLTATLGHVIATQNGTLSGVGVNLTTTGDGSHLKIDAAKRSVSGNLTAAGTSSDISVIADNGISAGGITSGNDTTLVSTGSVTTGVVMVGGQFKITGEAPVTDSPNDSSATALSASLGNVTAASVIINTTGAINAENVQATTGNIDLDSSNGGEISLGNLDAATTISLDTSGRVSAGSARAGEALSVGANVRASEVTFSGDINSASVDILSAGDVSLQNVDASTGQIGIRSSSGNIEYVTLEAEADIDLYARRDITGGRISSNTGNIDIESIENTNIGAVVAAGTITGRTRGNYDSGLMTSGGDIEVISGDTITVAGFDSGGSALLRSNNANVNLTANAVSVGDTTLIGTDINGQSFTVGGDITTNSSGRTLIVGTQDAAGAITARAGTNYRSERMTSGGDLVVEAENNARIAGFNSGGTARVESNSRNVVLTGNSSSFGSMELSANSGSVIATEDATIAGPGVRLRTTGDNAELMVNADGSFAAGVISTTGLASHVDINAGQNVDTNLIRTDNGNVDVFAGQSATIAGFNSGGTASVSADRGDVILTANARSVGDMALESVRRHVIVTEDGTLTGTGVSLRTAGPNSNISVNADDAVRIGRITANGDLVIGTRDVAPVGQATITDSVVANNVDIYALNAIETESLNATTGNINIESSAGSITTADQTARGSVSGIAGTTFTSELLTTRSGDISIDAVNNVLVAGFDSGASANIASSNGNIDITASGASRGDSNLVSAGVLEAQDINSDGSINLSSGSDISTNALDAGNNIMTNAAGATMIVSQRAGGSIMATSGTTFNSGIMSTTTGDITVGANDAVSIAGFNSGRNVSISSSVGPVAISSLGLSAGDTNITSAGSLDTQDLTAGGTIDLSSEAALNTLVLDAGGNIITNSGTSTVTGTQTAGGFVSGIAGTTFDSGMMQTLGTGDVTVIATNGVDIDGITSGGDIDLDSTSGGNLDVGDLDAQGTISLDTTGNIIAGELTGGGLSIGTVSPVSEISWDTAVSATSVTVAATGNITTQNITATNGAIDIDSTDGGNLDLGSLTATTDIDLDTTGSIDIGVTSAGGSLNIGTERIANDVTLNANVTAANMTVMSSGLFTSNAAVDAGSSARITSGDIGLQDGSILTADMVALLVAGEGDVILGTGAGAYVLDDGEHGRISTPEFSLYAGSNNVQVNDVTYSSDIGSDSVSVLSDGTIMFLGDVTGSGTGRVFRYAGAAGTGLASAIIGNSNDATLDFGEANLDLRASNIVFGNQGFIDQVLGLTSEEIAGSLVGNSGSALYNSVLTGGLSSDREANPVYLVAGNLDVTYANSVLFQNTGIVSTGISQTTGIDIGAEGGAGILTLLPTATGNTFAFFGRINGLEGRATALAGPEVVIFNNDLDVSSSRVNGCLIGSAAGCLSAQFGTLLVEIPEDGSTLIEADGSLLVPFDPLSGTNNEGLFSDAASNLDNENCERDSSGACVSGQGGR